MATTPAEAALDYLSRKGGVVLTPDSDVHEYVRRLTPADNGEPAGDAPPRPVLVWDATDGFRAPAGDVADLPEETDLIEALKFAQNYRGGAVFLFDCGGIDLAESVDRVRRAVKSLADRLALHRERAAVLLLHGPLPAGLEGAAPWAGPKPKAAPTAATPQ